LSARFDEQNRYVIYFCSIYIPVVMCTLLDSWWWTEKLSETCRILFQN